jgi:hypothetical protein
MSSEQVKPKDVEAIIKRRELSQTALLGSVAFAGLTPIQALARGPTPAKAGDTICSEIRNLQRKRYKTNKLVFGEVYVRQNNSEKVLGFYTLRGPFEDVFAPSVVISRTDGQVFAYANDLEWFIYIITDPASAWFTRVGNITREHLWDVVDRIRRNVMIWYLRFIGLHVLVKKFNEEEEVSIYATLATSSPLSTRRS